MEQTSENLNITSAFVEFLWSKPITEVSLQKAKDGVLDFLTASYTGRHDEGVHKLLLMSEIEGGTELAPLLFQNKKGSPTQSALINGYMGHALDYDDVHTEVRGHPSTVILPTLLAVAAEVSKIGIELPEQGKRFLESYIIGVEAMARLAQAVTHTHYENGFHNTSTIGVLAATLAGAYYKSYTVEQAMMALGFATTQASGLRIHFGTETKPLHAGFAAASAVRSLQLFQVGMRANQNSLDGPLSFLEVYGEGGRVARKWLLEGWDQEWRIASPGLWFKLYPFCSGAYYGVHAAEQIGPTSAELIRSIELTFTHHSDAALIHRTPKNGEEGRFSIEYIVALILSGELLDPKHFQKESFHTPCLAYMNKMNRVNVFDLPRSEKYTQITLHMQDGSLIQAVGNTPKGSPDNPVSSLELIDKFRTHIHGTYAEQLLATVQSLKQSAYLHDFLYLISGEVELK